MAERPTTFRLDAVLRSLGVKGGRFPALSDGPVVPVVVVSDFSATQAPEAVEARAFASAEIQAGDNQAVFFYFWSLGPGGCVVERLDLLTTVIGQSTAAPGENGSIFSDVSGGLTLGSWILAVVGSTAPPGVPAAVASAWDNSPTGAFSTRRIGFQEQFTNPAHVAVPKMALGGAATRSNLYATSPESGGLWPGFGPAVFSQRAYNGPDFDFWDPFYWVAGAGNEAGWGSVVPGTSSLAQDVRFYLPPSTGLVITRPDCRNATDGDTLNPAGCVSILWREIPESGGVP